MVAQSIEQARAAHAWQETNNGVDKEFVSLASGAPALIMSNGLMQTLAFYKAKGKSHHKKLLEAVLRWLGRPGGPLAGAQSFEDAMEKLHGSDPDLYLRATEEALEVLKWIRQFAKARERG